MLSIESQRCEVVGFLRRPTGCSAIAAQHMNEEGGVKQGLEVILYVVEV